MIKAFGIQTTAIRHISRTRVKASTLPAFWPLMLILALQAAISLTTLHNTAFQDEGLYLYAGRILVHNYWLGGPASLDHYAFYFSGYPDIYPLIGGFLDMIGGLELARSFSLFCMMGVNAIIYFSTQKFFQRPAAIFASATYGSLGAVLFLGRLATYDALCIFLIALATAIVYRMSTSRHSWLALMIGPLLVLSILDKYAAILFVPSILGILVLCSIIFLGWWRMLLRLSIVIISLVISLVVAYHFMDKAAFHAIAGSTTNRVVSNPASRVFLFEHVLQIDGIIYAAALLGFVLIFLRHKRFRLFALLLLASSCLAPAYHIYKQEFVSLDKHLAFSLFFAMPLVGYALARLSGYMQRTASNSDGRYWLAGLSCILLIFILGTQQSQSGYATWANSSDLSYALHTQMRDGSGRFLVEDIEVARYDARNITQQWQWNGLYYFYYVNAAHQQLLGDPAVTQAINDRYFALVELSFIYQPYEAHFIAQQMIASRNYDLIAALPFQNSYGTGHFYLWRSAAVAGHGNFTSMSQVIV